MFESKWIENDIFYMRMDNFFEEDKISQLYKECEQALSSAKYLIIDVRHNQGGSDSLYFPLFKYALPEDKGFNDLNIVDDFDMEILYTPFNTEQRLISFTEQLNDPATSQETKDLINNFKEELITNEEKGYVRYPSDISSFLPELKGISVSPKLD
ncbi:S41 family peptidase [Streptococcus parauberis]|uniref:S41 family peptidase n=1 Tax=Streptococcus parauberis TaxID=1348 RepID=UPI00214BC535|nr:S41 family peptidase [Streptococcus parauberis]